MKLIIAHLYPRLMNTYGDTGNLLSLQYRCQKRGITVTVRKVRPQDNLPAGSFDLLFAGGGQDQQQITVAADLQKRKKVLTQAASQGIPMLTICGSYQLFGQYFQPFEKPKLKGIAIFDNYTVGSKKRKIGNILIQTDRKSGLSPTTLIGFENHSGNTFLNRSATPLGQVKIGYGNNDRDKTAGTVFKNTYGCYLHGSLLPKNPHFADHLIKIALEKKYRSVNLQPLNDDLEWRAHRQAIKRTNKLSRPLLKYI